MHTQVKGAPATANLATAKIRGLALSARITAMFGLIWGVAGASALGPYAPVVAVVVVGISAGLFLVARALVRRAPRGAQDGSALRGVFARRPYRLAVLFEAVAIPIAGAVLVATGHGDSIASVVAIIVGLHFFGLSPAFHAWRFVAVGGAMVLVGLISLVLPAHTGAGSATMDPRLALVGLGCAVALWAGAAPIALLTLRSRPVPPGAD